MIFAVTNRRIQWSLDFGPDSVVLIVKDFVQGMTINSQDFHPLLWNLLLSQSPEFWDIHLTQILIFPNQEGTFETRKEVFASAGDQVTDMRGYELSDFKHTESFSESSLVEFDAIFGPGIDIPFSSTAFKYLEMAEEDYPKTPLYWIKMKTRRTLSQQLHCLSVPLNLLS